MAKPQPLRVKELFRSGLGQLLVVALPVQLANGLMFNPHRSMDQNLEKSCCENVMDLWLVGWMFNDVHPHIIVGYGRH